MLLNDALDLGKITDLCTFYAPSSDLCSEHQIYVWFAVLCFAKLVRFGKLSLWEYFADLCIARIYLHIYVSILQNYVRSFLGKNAWWGGEGGRAARRCPARNGA